MKIGGNNLGEPIGGLLPVRDYLFEAGAEVTVSNACLPMMESKNSEQNTLLFGYLA